MDTATSPVDTLTTQELNVTLTSTCESSSTAVTNSGELAISTTVEETIDVSSIQNHAEEADSLKSQVPAITTGSLKKVCIN